LFGFLHYLNALLPVFVLLLLLLLLFELLLLLLILLLLLFNIGLFGVPGYFFVDVLVELGEVNLLGGVSPEDI
jgi:hypothetical protein